MTTYNVNIEVSESDIENLLISAFEGGSNYWYMIEKEIMPTEITYKGSFGEDEKNLPVHLYAMNKGGALLIRDTLDETGKKGLFRLDIKALKAGLQNMAELHPLSFADITSDNADQNTGDLFLQCCVFGDEIYS